jgi:hypothetical protein
MTSEYTFVTPERQNELTRRIQEKLSEATMRSDGMRLDPSLPPPPATSEKPPNLINASPATQVLQ